VTIPVHYAQDCSVYWGLTSSLSAPGPLYSDALTYKFDCDIEGEMHFTTTTYEMYIWLIPAL
jgi:hypothetical protein